LSGFGLNQLLQNVVSVSPLLLTLSLSFSYSLSLSLSLSHSLSLSLSHSLSFLPLTKHLHTFHLSLPLSLSHTHTHAHISVFLSLFLQHSLSAPHILTCLLSLYLLSLFPSLTHTHTHTKSLCKCVSIFLPLYFSLPSTHTEALSLLFLSSSLSHSLRLALSWACLHLLTLLCYSKEKLLRLVESLAFVTDDNRTYQSHKIPFNGQTVEIVKYKSTCIYRYKYLCERKHMLACLLRPQILF